MKPQRPTVEIDAATLEGLVRDLELAVKTIERMAKIIAQFTAQKGRRK